VQKSELAWRKSGGARRSLGCVPFKACGTAYAQSQTPVWQGLVVALEQLRPEALPPWLGQHPRRCSWPLDHQHPRATPRPQLALCNKSVGIYLGLREFAATSDGAVVEAQQFYRTLEEKLAIAQRANKTDRIKAIHAKIAHGRKDFQPKVGTRLVQAYGAIFIGNVNAPQPCENDPGQIGSGCRLKCIPDHAAGQVQSRRRVVRGSQ